jgi:cytochrome c peroxidase
MRRGMLAIDWNCTHLRSRVLAVTVLLASVCTTTILSARDAPGSVPSRTPPSTASTSYYANVLAHRPSVTAMARIGRILFSDPTLSVSGKIACSTCHDPSNSFGPANDLPVQRGGANGQATGVRAVPSLRYLQSVPPFTEHFFESDGNDSEDQGPAGGRTWDGRSQSAHDQARLPLFSAFEMGNASPEAVVAKVRSSPYAGRFNDVFGKDPLGRNIFDTPGAAFDAVLMALEVYQQSPAEFYPYSSKYDAWLRKQARLTAQEERGLALFNNPARGNCASCHPSGIRNGAFPAFTDYGYAALGLPRNPAIPANADPNYYDLGLCGPLRTDLSNKPETCGLFRTPSLRNVAKRRVFFHNGVVKRLEDAVRFYATRDTQPQSWYPRSADGTVRKFDDLPPQYLQNIENKPPFGQQVGAAPALSASEVVDLVAFLNTLTDDWTP